MPAREDMRVAARLAQLSFSDDELERVRVELADILTRLDVLHSHIQDSEAGAERALSAEPAAAGPGGPQGAAARSAGLRRDVSGADRLNVPPSYLAPEWRDGFFTVPRLSTHKAEE